MTLATATPRVRLRAAERSEQLLDVAEELFTTHGYEGVSIEDIARAAGVTRPVVYQHFPSKEGVFLGCVTRARRAFQDNLDRVHSSADLDEAIRIGGRIFFEAVAENPRRWALLFASSTSFEGHLAEELAQLRYGTVTTIADNAATHAPHIPRPELEAFAYAVSGIGEQLGRWWLRHPEYSLDEVVALDVAAVRGVVDGMLTLFQEREPHSDPTGGP